MMYKEITVKKGRKKHRCGLCHDYILTTESHIKIATVQDGDFHSWREHYKCKEIKEEMCGDCEYNSDCQSSLEECFDEYVRKENI